MCMCGAYAGISNEFFGKTKINSVGTLAVDKCYANGSRWKNIVVCAVYFCWNFSACWVGFDIVASILLRKCLVHRAIPATPCMDDTDKVKNLYINSYAFLSTTCHYHHCLRRSYMKGFFCHHFLPSENDAQTSEFHILSSTIWECVRVCVCVLCCAACRCTNTKEASQRSV